MNSSQDRWNDNTDKKVKSCHHEWQIIKISTCSSLIFQFTSKSFDQHCKKWKRRVGSSKDNPGIFLFFVLFFAFILIFRVPISDSSCDILAFLQEKLWSVFNKLPSELDINFIFPKNIHITTHITWHTFHSMKQRIVR